MSLAAGVEVALRQVSGVVYLSGDEHTVEVLLDRALAAPDALERCAVILELAPGERSELRVSWVGTGLTTDVPTSLGRLALPLR